MAAMAQGTAPGDGGLTAVPFTEVRITDAFWLPRLRTTREKTLRANLKWCEDTGRFSNFAKAAGIMEGKFEGIFFNDSDVYKVIEGASYLLHLEADPELDAYLDRLIATIAAAQQEDGYLNTYYTLVEPDQRWTNLPVRHELYCAGHLFEAAVAHYRATGKRTLLDVACKFADHIDSVFGPDKRHGVPGHEEIELALVKLYHATGEERYFKLAKFFIDERGNAAGHKLYGEYCQDHMPVRQQSEIVGHAVRAMYLYSGVADVARLTDDQALIDAMGRIWDDVVLHKMFLTGGIGTSAANEGFTTAYDLPNDTAYAETCASIGMALWNHRLNLLHGEARFADVLERALYNGLLSGVSLDGEGFFYVNPLGSRGDHHRQRWFDCACCPTNIVRFLPSLGGYVYAYSDDAVYVNLYLSNTGRIPLKGGTVALTQETAYPWRGDVRISVGLDAPAAFELCLRLPGWCRAYHLALNGETVRDAVVEKGYIRMRRTWRPGDAVEFMLEMPVRRTYAHPRVAADIGRVALERGPIVYCLEAVDNGGRVRNLALPPGTAIDTEYCPDLLGGVTVLKGTALARQMVNWDDTLYQEACTPEEAPFVAVPYYAWDHRAPGEMVVWLPECIGLAESPPRPTLASGSTATASRVEGSLSALADGVEPANSNDQGIPRFTWWDHRGAQEWVQYEFPHPARVSEVEVYWFDDRGSNGQCRTPASWRLLYKDGDVWKPVETSAPFPTDRDQYNRVVFTPVVTQAVRIEAQLRENASGGILEWRVATD